MRARKTKNKVKMRKSTRSFCIAVASVLFVISAATLFNSSLGEKTNKTKEEIYSYTNKFSYGYQVNLLPNKYIEESSLGMNEIAYITDLIDNINLDLNYNYNSDNESTIKYTYSIKGILSGVYTRDGKEQKVWTKQYTLKEPTENIITGKNFNIKENLLLDLKEQNKLVRDFEQEIGITVDTTYNVILEVETNTEVDGEQVNNRYSSSLAISLGKKTTTINGENNKEDTQYVSKEIEQTIKIDSTSKVISAILFAISIVSLYYIKKKTVTMNKTRNEFRLELNRILRLCQDKIVQVSSKLEVDTTNVIDVKDFGEIVKVSEELFKPILYWISPRDDEAWFTVMSNGVTYRYILRR
ncbi:MAG: DUF5305 family protein [Clostridia bacterium]